MSISSTSPVDAGSPNGFGELIGRILQERQLTHNAAAQILNTSQPTLSGIISGRVRTNQEFIRKRKWRTTLRTLFPKLWRRYGDEFDYQVSLLAPHSARDVDQPHPEPVDQQTLGYALWNILGGTTLDTKKARRVLQIKRENLYAILNNNHRISQHYALSRKWPTLCLEVRR